MSNMFTLPPQPTGNAERDLIGLRDYLVRIARQLDAAENQLAEGVLEQRISTAVKKSGASDAAIEVIRNDAAALRQLIVKTADEIYSYTDSITTELRTEYVAKSEFGTYQKTVQTLIEQTAAATIESYNFATQLSVEALQQNILSNINGKIQRGFINVNGEDCFGIAISNNLRTTGEQETDVNGIVYEVISEHQNFGLYTANGWMFFIDGIRVGYFDSEDRTLHVGDIEIENSLTMGDWLVSSVNGWGIRYIG